MNDVTRLLVIVFALQSGRTGGVKPDGGYCIGNQCFSVSGRPADFDAAQTECGDQGGHLMTVRSGVSQDVLSILLRNIQGRFWIGLHLPTGCPDPSTGLRGFRWVTKDNDSDFSNWPAAVDAGCSSPRCVVVSSADDFKWTREPCASRAAGFLCEYSFDEPCDPLKAGAAEAVNYSTPLGIQGEDLLSLPPGSIAVRVPAETKYICFSGRWIQAPWKCDVLEGGCEHKCTPDPEHAPVCYCPAGQTVHPENRVTCEETRADPCASLRCAHACYEDEGEGAYACACRQGFKLAADGRSCVDFNDCTDARVCPGDNSRCVNTAGGFECVCVDGYGKSGAGACVDVDECTSAPCEHMCDNTPGSYRCSCYDGYKEDPKEPHRCRLHCGRSECPAECDPNDPYQCYCPEGYILEERAAGNVCIDLDECSFFFCDQECENTYGGYECACSPGYTLMDGDRCVKSDDEGGDAEGSGAPPGGTAAPPTPHPGPTTPPPALTAGGVAGIVVCVLLLLALLVFLASRVLCGGSEAKSEDGVKAPENEAHTLQPLTSEA